MKSTDMTDSDLGEMAVPDICPICGDWLSVTFLGLACSTCGWHEPHRERQ